MDFMNIGIHPSFDFNIYTSMFCHFSRDVEATGTTTARPLALFIFNKAEIKCNDIEW